MTTKRLAIVLGCLLLGLSGVFLLSHNPRPQPAGVILELPRFIAPDWVGEEIPVSEKERQVLAADTGFARRRYVNRIGDSIFLGIVLSGEDMANSIHRPERCLVAQGWTLQPGTLRRFPVGDGTLESTRILHTQPWPPSKPQFVRRDLTYYWFIGSRDRTASHLQRTLFDMRDRLLHGENQRWAYVTAEALITEGLRGPFPVRTEEETSRMIEDFLARAVPTFVRPPEGDGKVALSR